ncbi:hypothetical protein [Clostridium ganghwense]|uniref:LSM domain-containing protein n=1 Tax=Clostridium ganghwense TaxID=312089 RepID=A0ABT4CNM9_9CLOT|nr:hypothetical protein [Clostridium ganghwense]MCY6369676.1 hypothetical protein [Clostridium ganghwense]
MCEMNNNFENLCNPCGNSPMTLTEFIRKNYRGSRIVVRLRSGIFIAGEVVDGFDNVISLRATGGRIFYVSGIAIDFFF